MPTNDEKFKRVIDKNTFYFFNLPFEEKYEGYINSLRETLLVVKNQVETEGLQKEIFVDLLKNKENGLRVLLALTGFSNEYLKRLLTVVRVTNDKELSKLIFKKKWCKDISIDNIKEYGDKQIEKFIKTNEHFTKGLVNLFFEGSTIPFLANTIPLFELKKLSIEKLGFKIPAMLDTLVRYKEKGSYAGHAQNNAETVISNIIKASGFTYQKGDLTELLNKETVAKRTMDFILPDKVNPKLIIESSFLVTTSSGQDDKSKTEGNINILIRKYYKKAKFIGFVDGIGWYVRKGDLRRMITAYDEVYTFHKTELERFKKDLPKYLA